MNAYQLHRDGDCWPPTCLVCAVECDVCGEHLGACTCPTLPIGKTP
jgi:hypothetical protein